VSFDGNIFNTTFVSSSRLEASIPAAALGATPRSIVVMVIQISGTAPSSNAISFDILPAAAP